MDYPIIVKDLRDCLKFVAICDKALMNVDEMVDVGGGSGSALFFKLPTLAAVQSSPLGNTRLAPAITTALHPLLLSKIKQLTLDLKVNQL